MVAVSSRGWARLWVAPGAAVRRWSQRGGFAIGLPGCFLFCGRFFDRPEGRLGALRAEKQLDVLDDGRMRFGDVALFAFIGVEVVEFDGSVEALHANSFPASADHDGLAKTAFVKFEIEMVVIGLGAADEGSCAAAMGARAKEGGDDTDGIQIFGRSCAGEFGECGHHVAAVAEMIGGRGLKFAGPPGDEWGTDSAVGEITLETVLRSFRLEEIVSLCAFFVWAVIGSENDERVAVDADEFEFLQ